MSSFQLSHLDVSKHFGTPRCVLCSVDLIVLVFVYVTWWTAEITYETGLLYAVCLYFSSHNVTVLTF